MTAKPRAPRSLVVMACAAAVVYSPSPLVAQELFLEEIIVTARKRAESLQETPLAVTALDADALQAAGVRNLADLNQITPNIEVSSGNGNAGLANIYIRGVGQRNTGANIDSGVGIYIDGIYAGRPDGALLDINDIQSVQVLRGPQGTLFGKNTTGGALVFTTNKPIDEFEGMAGVRAGNYDRLDGDFMVNVPLADQLWTRISGAYRSRDGFIDNEYDNKDYMDEDRHNVIWQTRWLPTEDLTLDLNLNWAETDQTARPLKCRLVPDYEGWQATLFNTIAITPATGRTLDDFCEDSQNAGGGDAHAVMSDLPGEYHAENKGVSLTAEWLLGDNLNVKSITGWRNTEASQDDDVDNTPTPFLHRTNNTHPFGSPSETDQYSQELQLTGSAFSDRMQFVTGVFWFKEENEGRVNVNLLGPYDPALLDTVFLNSTATARDAENEAIAAYAQVEWEFDEHWRATLGVRYTDEDRELKRTRYLPDASTLDANGGAVSELFPGSGLYQVERPGFEFNENFDFVERDYTSDKINNDDTTPMASVQYIVGENDWVETGSVYLTYSEGFLSGGISEAPTGDLEDFEPEEVENWELGFKLDMLGRRLRVNGALFYTDYKNRQLTSLAINPATGSPAPATINAAKSRITGLELETFWLPAESWLLQFNMTLSDGDIREYDDIQITLADTPEPAPGCDRQNLSIIQVDSCPNDRSDENLPRLAEQSYFLAAEYHWDASFGSLIPRVQASWKLDIDYCFDAASCQTGYWFEDEQFELSARLTWISNDDRWMAALYGNNLTDEDYLVGSNSLVESSGVGGEVAATPRMYGAELQYRF